MAQRTQQNAAAGQIQVMQSLTQEASAWLLGCTTRHLRDHGGAIVRNADGSYNAKELVDWNRKRVPIPNLTDEEYERCLQAGMMLLDPDPRKGAAPFLGFLEELRDQYGDAGIVAFFGIFKDAYAAEIREQRDRSGPESFDSWVGNKRERYDDEVRHPYERSSLRLVVWCVECRKRRVGRRWVAGDEPDRTVIFRDICSSLQVQEKAREAAADATPFG